MRRRLDFRISENQRLLMEEGKRSKKTFIDSYLNKWSSTKGKEPLKLSKIRDILGKIYDMNKDGTIHTLKPKLLNPNALIPAIEKTLEVQYETWRKLYEKESTLGSELFVPNLFKYIGALYRYIIHPTTAAVLVGFFTMYATYYWLENEPSIILATLLTEGNAIQGIIAGTMAFMLNMTMGGGIAKEKDIIKTFDCLAGDVKAMAMFLVHLSYDHQKYILEKDNSLTYDNRVRDQFHKMQYLLAVMVPTARKVLQGKRSFLFPEYLGDSSSWFFDLADGRIKGNRYNRLTLYGLLLGMYTATTVGFVIYSLYALILEIEALWAYITTIVLLVTLVPILLLTAWDKCRVCGWGFCCKSTPYADVDDLELIPFTKKRKDTLRILCILCCRSPSHKRDYRRWSNERCQDGGDLIHCTSGLEYSLYRKIKETSARSGFDLFETQMTILLDELNRIGELGLGFGKDEGAAVMSAAIAKWENIYASWGTLASHKTYGEPTLVLLYRAFFIFLYAFITPVKYLPLHSNNKHWCVVDCDGYVIDPYIWWSVVDISVVATLWWVSYYIRNPFNKGLWFGRTEITDGISNGAQMQINRFLINAKSLEEKDYTSGDRFGWGGKGKNPYPLGFKRLKFVEYDKTIKYGESNVNLGNVESLEELDKISGNKFDYTKVIKSMEAKKQLLTPKQFKEELRKTGPRFKSEEALLERYVDFYRLDFNENNGKQPEEWLFTKKNPKGKYKT